MRLEISPYLTLAQSMEQKIIYPTNVATWENFPNCRRFSLLKDVVGLEPRYLTAENRLEQYVIDGMRQWHRNHKRCEVAKVMKHRLEDGPRRDDEVSVMNNALSIVEAYMEHDCSEPLRLSKDSISIQHWLHRDAGKEHSIYLCDRIDGTLRHEGCTYLLVHRLVDQLTNMEERMWCDLGTAIRAIYGGKRLNRKVEGVVYNLIASEPGKEPVVGRQYLRFKKNFLARAGAELKMYAAQFNESKTVPEEMTPNRQACSRGDRVCQYMRLCGGESARENRQAFILGQGDPELNKRNRSDLLEYTLADEGDRKEIRRAKPRGYRARRKKRSAVRA